MSIDTVYTANVDLVGHDLGRCTKFNNYQRSFKSVCGNYETVRYRSLKSEYVR